MQAKTFYFCQQSGNIMNIEDYEEWKTAKDNAEPEYSSNYQELVELILAGKEVPGIKQIPDTVLEGQSSAHVSEVRKKPWEIKKEQETAARAEIHKEVEESINESEPATAVDEDERESNKENDITLAEA